jgi:hypothetical protein
MATRSMIAIEDEDGTITSIYCHWDGYIENNGVLLLENYQDREKVKQLIALGDISALDKNIEGDESVIAYHRDFKYTLNSRTPISNIEDMLDEYSDIEYIYVFTNNNIWLVNKGGSSLVEVLKTAIEEG